MNRTGGPAVSQGTGQQGPGHAQSPVPAAATHSPELSLQVHKVLLGQCHTRAGVDDQGLAVLEVGCFEPPLGQLEKGPQPVSSGGGGWGGRGWVPSAPSIEHSFSKRMLRAEPPTPFKILSLPFTLRQLALAREIRQHCQVRDSRKKKTGRRPGGGGGVG